VAGPSNTLLDPSPPPIPHEMRFCFQDDEEIVVETDLPFDANLMTNRDTTDTTEILEGEFHDHRDAKWIVIRGQLRGHNDTPFGRPTPGRPIGRPGFGRPLGEFGGFGYY
jgi:hypothetical protein